MIQTVSFTNRMGYKPDYLINKWLADKSNITITNVIITYPPDDVMGQQENVRIFYKEESK